MLVLTFAANIVHLSLSIVKSWIPKRVVGTGKIFAPSLSAKD